MSYNQYPMSKQQYYAQQNQFNQNPSPYWKGGRKPKRSGIKIVTPYGSEKGLFMGGWKVSKGVKWNIKVFRDQYQREVAPTKSKTGKQWVSVRIILNAPMQKTVSVQGMMNISNHKVYISDWNWILNPGAPNGGYVGKHISKQK